MEEIDFTPAYEAFAREYEAILRFQAPEKSGKLKESIRVSLLQIGEDAFGFPFESVFYGKFTDLGTLDYLTSEDNRGPWTPDPVRENDNKGIAPRFWSSINETDQARMEMILETHKEKIIQEYFDAQR